jgi:hypothetical protein
MKRSFWIILFLFLIVFEGFSQQVKWQVGSFPFFDNTEFGKSAFTIPQTMAGIIFAPEIGLRWDSIHNFNVGVNLLHEFGSPNAIDRFYPTAYYEYDNGPVTFIMGAFPRDKILENWPRLFFSDSISYYRPNINGISWEFRQDQKYLNLWLDWTGRQSPTVHEEFFMGVSGRYTLGDLYLQNFSYMFHYAGKMDPVVSEPLHDNGLFCTSVGIDMAKKAGLNKLDINGGWVIGLERSRADNTGWIKLNGFLMETRIEYKVIGLFDSFYTGKGQMYFYSTYSDKLYWGDPVYRATIYNRSDFYIRFIQNRYVNMELTYSLHYLENRIYHEQMLKVVLNINNR